MAGKITRNTPLLSEVVKALDDHLINPEGALLQLEEYFGDGYVLNSGDFACVANAAKKLRLVITPDDAFKVLDYIAEKAMVGITIDHVETAVWELFGNRFVEPEDDE